MGDLDNSADVLDIRDLIARIEELRLARDEMEEDDGELPAVVWAIQEPEDAAELAALESFVEDMKGYGGDEQWEGDWYPVTLVRDSYWEDYAREFAEDVCGDAVREAAWPTNCIDWERAARELQMDYGSAEFDGVTYWYR